VEARVADREELVVIVVVTYNSAPLLPDLVSSLPAGPGGVETRLVVVDNASDDDSVAVATYLRPDAVVIQMGRNAGYAAAINAGVAAAPEHTCALVLNPDVRLRPGCVNALLSAVRTPGTGIAVPLLVDGDGRRIDSLRREPTVVRGLADALLGARRAGQLGRLGEVVTAEQAYRAATVTDWAQGSTLLITAECSRSIGTWDESFFLYSEETEFLLRARDRGFATRYTPAARAVHLGGDSRRSPELWALLVTNRVRLFGRRNGWAWGTAFWAALLLRESSRAALGRPIGRAAATALLSPRRMRAAPGPDCLRTGRAARGPLVARRGTAPRPHGGPAVVRTTGRNP